MIDAGVNRLVKHGWEKRIPWITENFRKLYLVHFQINSSVGSDTL